MAEATSAEFLNIALPPKAITNCPMWLCFEIPSQYPLLIPDIGINRGVQNFSKLLLQGNCFQLLIVCPFKSFSPDIRQDNGLSSCTEQAP